MAWDDREHDAVVKSLAVVCELTGSSFSEPARIMLVKQLAGYPAPVVVKSLERCAAECKFKLTLADIIQRLDDGRPGAEEAWASFPKTEDAAGVVTTEMSVAWGAASPLYADGDKIAARMAFKEAYEREVRKARAEGKGVNWSVSPGFDKSSTEQAAIEALRRGLLPEHHALQYVRPENRERALASVKGQKALPEAKPLTLGMLS